MDIEEAMRTQRAIRRLRPDPVDDSLVLHLIGGVAGPAPIRSWHAVGHANVPLEGRFMAVVKACGDGAVLSHYSVAALFGFVPSAARRHRPLLVHRRTQCSGHCATWSRWSGASGVDAVCVT